MRIRSLTAAVAAAAVCAAIAPPPVRAADDEMITVSGEMIDSWCYLSGVMGGPEAVTGSAHHTCALWCAAGGIPVGLLGEDGQVYMILQWQGDDDVAGGDAILDVQSDKLVATGRLHERDGMSYIIVSQVVDNTGITNLSHADYGVTPGFAIPEPEAKE